MKTKFDVMFKKLAPGLAILVIIAVAAFIFQQTDAQKKDNPSGKDPKVSIKVNKQTDKNGNVTRYDSTYVWSWSGNENAPENMDSLISSLHKSFFRNHFSDADSLFSDPFQWGFQNLNDSSFFSGNFEQFFKNDFGSFDKIMKDHQKMMKDFFKQEPLLKVPDEVVPSAPKEPKKKIEKQNDLVHPNNYQDKGATVKTI
jgi:hypothetical protein